MTKKSVPKLRTCSVRGGLFVEPCENLSNAAEIGNPRGKRKGIFFWCLFNREHKPSRTFVGVKSGSHVEKGLVLNFCPFCGERIDAPVNKEPHP